MRLRAYDTINVSAVQSDSIRPGQVFEISDAAGDELLKAHPGLFAVISPTAGAKADPAPENKAEPAPANKAAADPIYAPPTRTSRRSR